MRSYTNRNGEIIEVSQKHLETAIKIKKELQKASPSRKCQWNNHKLMMEREGYFDSDTNESYRCLIKAVQKTMGELPKAPKYADMVADGKLQSIKELVGEVAYEKRENQLVLRQLNKVKREVIDFTLISEQIGEAFKKINITSPPTDYTPKTTSDKSMLLLPSDWHIGYMNKNYNHEIAKQRIKLYIKKTIEYAKVFDINEFHILHLGDIVENLYMHKNTQSFNSEFSFSEQIVKATEMLYQMLDEFSQVGNVVFHGVVRGNHGRMSTKGETIHNDCAEYIVHESVKKLIEISKNTSITVEDSEYNIERSLINVKGKRIKGTHGDFEGQNDKDKIQKHISLENELIDILALGHFHNYQLKTENHGRLVYGSGCLQGATDYGKSLKYNNPASQGLIVIGEEDEVIPINILLESV